MMKRTCSVLLIALMCFSACSQNVKYEQPVQFYYCTAGNSFDTNSTTIGSETIECATMGTETEILEAYLTGPQSSALRSPFPAGLMLVSYARTNSEVTITFSAELGNLSKLDLTLACGCITMTVLSFAEVETVHISAENVLLNGQETITMNAETLQLLDICTDGQ